jgi:hypothetical protein
MRRGHAIFVALAAWVLFCAGFSVYLFMKPAVKINLFGKLIVLWLAASLVVFVAAHLLRMVSPPASEPRSSARPEDSGIVDSSGRVQMLEVLGKRAAFSAIGAVILFAAAGALGMLR